MSEITHTLRYTAAHFLLLLIGSLDVVAAASSLAKSTDAITRTNGIPYVEGYTEQAASSSQDIVAEEECIEVAQRDSDIPFSINDASSESSIPTGIGVLLKPKNDYFEIECLLDGGGASVAGIRPGSVITHVNGTSVRDYSLDDLKKLLHGLPGSSVSVTTSYASGHDSTYIIVRSIPRRTLLTGSGGLDRATFRPRAGYTSVFHPGDTISMLFVGKNGEQFDTNGYQLRWYAFYENRYHFIREDYYLTEKAPLTSFGGDIFIVPPNMICTKYQIELVIGDSVLASAEYEITPTDIQPQVDGARNTSTHETAPSITIGVGFDEMTSSSRPTDVFYPGDTIIFFKYTENGSLMFDSCYLQLSYRVGRSYVDVLHAAVSVNPHGTSFGGVISIMDSNIYPGSYKIELVVGARVLGTADFHVRETGSRQAIPRLDIGENGSRQMTLPFAIQNLLAKWSHGRERGNDFLAHTLWLPQTSFVVRNTGSTTLENLGLKAVFSDENQVIIGEAHDSVDDLEPGYGKQLLMTSAVGYEVMGRFIVPSAKISIDIYARTGGSGPWRKIASTSL